LTAWDVKNPTADTKNYGQENTPGRVGFLNTARDQSVKRGDCEWNEDEGAEKFNARKGVALSSEFDEDKHNEEPEDGDGNVEVEDSPPVVFCHCTADNRPDG